MADDDINRGLEGIPVAPTRLSSIDGGTGELLIGGFPLAALATNATYEETLYLLFHDRLPDEAELAAFRADLAGRRTIGDEVRAVLERAAREGKPAMDAPRMGAGAANLGEDDGGPEVNARRVIAAFPTIVATYWRYRQGETPVNPDPSLSHAANYVHADRRAPVRGGRPRTGDYLNAVVDHGLNASTFTARVVVSTESDVVSAATAAVSTLKGPLHGGAPGPVLDMLQEVFESGTPEAYVREKLEAGERLMGFGHADDGGSDFFETVVAFEDVAVDLLAEHKPGRRLETNVEFYTAALLHGVGIPRDLFTATFAVARAGGWMAHCLEQLADNRLIRPDSKYVGESGRTWTPVEQR